MDEDLFELVQDLQDLNLHSKTELFQSDQAWEKIKNLPENVIKIIVSYLETSTYMY